MRRLLEKSTELDLVPFREALTLLVTEKEKRLSLSYGNERKFREILAGIPDYAPSVIDLSADWIRIGRSSDITDEQKEELERSLRLLVPWRKGPYELFGIRIDTEWASHIKWNRIEGKIAPLEGRRVLDIGASSGYYLYRMAAKKPAMLLGIDPYLVFYYQYLALQRFVRDPRIFYLPAKFEEMPQMTGYFDTVFCMGILYHRISPIETLRQIRAMMVKGGELVLETLVMEGEGDTALFPQDRYAKMRNVFFIPTVPCLVNWLSRSGFTNIRCLDTSPTTCEEQRKTDWVPTESLADFLDPDDPKKTVEGYQAPVRSVIVAEVK